MARNSGAVAGDAGKASAAGCDLEWRCKRSGIGFMGGTLKSSSFHQQSINFHVPNCKTQVGEHGFPKTGGNGSVNGGEWLVSGSE